MHASRFIFLSLTVNTSSNESLRLHAHWAESPKSLPKNDGRCKKKSVVCREGGAADPIPVVRLPHTASYDALSDHGKRQSARLRRVSAHADTRNRHSHMPSSSRHRSLPRPNRTKRPVRRVRSATRRYPETPGALPEPKGAPSARIGPTDRGGHRSDERCANHGPNELRTRRNAARHVRRVRGMLGMR